MMMDGLGLASAQGLGQLPYIEPIDGATFNGTGTIAANYALLTRFRVEKPMSLSKVSFFVASAAGNADVGVYQWDGATTWTRLTSNGGAAVAGTNANQALTFTSVLLQPGVDYFLAFANDSGTATFLRQVIGNQRVYGNICVNKATSYPLPASIASATGSTIVPWLLGE